MAAFISSAFTATDRRKKVVTYGKSSRLPTIPTHATSNDAPSPERPRKHTSSSSTTTKKTGGSLKDIGSPQHGRASIGSPDIFDVPSEDEFVARSAVSTRKLPKAHGISEEGWGLPPHIEKVPGSSRQLKGSVKPLRKPDTARPVVPTAKSTLKSVPPQRTAPVALPTSANAKAPLVQRGKTPQPMEDAKQRIRGAQAVEHPIVKAKAVSRALTANLIVIKDWKPAKVNSVPISGKSVRHQLGKQPEDTDIFDVPSTDDEAPVPTPKPVRRAPIIRINKAEEPTQTITGTARNDRAESDNSIASNNRKRKGSVSSNTTVKSALKQKEESSLPQRSRKYQKREDGITSQPGSLQPPTTTITTEAQAALPAINKPKRTRVRTVPVINRPLITKGQSSPAKLHNMLPARPMSKPSAIAEVAEATILGDDTMYEIPEMLATPVRHPRNEASGSTTPRQKAMFSSLLGTTSSSSTPMPSISKLQLTDTKPRSLLGALSRSKSDLTHSHKSVKLRLIDKLKYAESSSEDGASESGSDEDLDEKEDHDQTTKKTTSKPHEALPLSEPVSDDMDVDVNAAADSQTSQATSGFGVRQRLTYAKSRSYLQEANPEDDLLMSMDISNNTGFGSQNQDDIEADEEDASQVRANHELKTQGENSSFRFANEMLIDDISQKSSNAIRRSAMLEICTKMADETFVHQLLDSSLVHQFLSNITSNGEIIFDFAATVAILFMLSTQPTYTILDEIYRSGIMTSLASLLDESRDIERIAKDRKTNLSKIARDSAIAFRAAVLKRDLWSSYEVSLMSPQLVALKALELQVLEMRKSGNLDAVLDQSTIIKLVDIATDACERLTSGNRTMQDCLVSELVLSTLETVSLANQSQSTWSLHSLQRLAGLMPVFFQANDRSTMTLAVKLCMNLTNNKPKACRQFSEAAFVHSLAQAIIYCFKLLQTSLGEEQHTRTLENLVLSLGAMINLTEHSDRARRNVDDGKDMIGTLVDTFLDGSARAAQVSYCLDPSQVTNTDFTQAESMEESQSSVAVGYLSVLLGNLCLNEDIKSKLRTRLPGQQLAPLIDKIKEFVRVHEHVDRKAKHFEGDEGQETWQNYTARLMHVIDMLEEAES
jgi:hypothetical protein